MAVSKYKKIYDETIKRNEELIKTLTDLETKTQYLQTESEKNKQMLIILSDSCKLHKSENEHLKALVRNYLAKELL